MDDPKTMTRKAMETEMESLDRKMQWHLGRPGSCAHYERYRKRYNRLVYWHRKRFKQGVVNNLGVCDDFAGISLDAYRPLGRCLEMPQATEAASCEAVSVSINEPGAGASCALRRCPSGNRWRPTKLRPGAGVGSAALRLSRRRPPDGLRRSDEKQARIRPPPKFDRFLPR